MIGAFFAWISSNNREGAWYIMPAVFALFLAVSDLCFVVCSLKESLPPKHRLRTFKSGISGAFAYINPVDLFQFNGVSGLNLQGEIFFHKKFHKFCKHLYKLCVLFQIKKAYKH